jgi:hypothetical protein
MDWSAILHVYTVLLAERGARFGVTALVRQWRRLTRSLRPEPHYMRGPGPKWRLERARDADNTRR